MQTVHNAPKKKAMTSHRTPKGRLLHEQCNADDPHRQSH
jgi:hypothetical protein